MKELKDSDQCKMEIALSTKDSRNKKFNFNDKSLYLLISINLFLIVLALIENWNLLKIMFIYWCQSVIIGIFTFIRMITLKEFSTEGINYNTLPPTRKTKIFMAFFFLFHYGFFHFGYLIFLFTGLVFLTGRSPGPTDPLMILIIICFFINHLFSFLYNREKDGKTRLNIGRIMMFPYIRIIPMHLTIIFGGFLLFIGLPSLTLVLFLVLKTIADAFTHMVEHKIEIKKDNLTLR